jgi:hypothetical protein
LRSPLLHRCKPLSQRFDIGDFFSKSPGGAAPAAFRLAPQDVRICRGTYRSSGAECSSHGLEIPARSQNFPATVIEDRAGRGWRRGSRIDGTGFQKLSDCEYDLLDVQP